MKATTLALLFVLVAAAASRDIDITAPDGTRLKASYFPADRPGPAVVLLHMCITTRASWETVAQQLSAAGIHALTIDNRGFGESGGPRFQGASPDVLRELRGHWPGDFDAALAWLISQPGVDQNRIGVGGGSCGVDNAVNLASRHPNVRALVLLAGMTDDKGLDYLTKNPWLPVFGTAAADDQYDNRALDTMRFFAESSGNARNRFVGFKDGGHGTEIFAPHPELPRQIVAWLIDTLVTSPAGADVAFTRRATPASEFWSAVTQPKGSVKAAQIFRDARRRDRGAFVFPESVVNRVAYAKLQDGAADEAVTLFRLNVEVFPASANAQDSLADGYLALGQNQLALAAAEKCLELLARDTINDRLKAQLRELAAQKIARLKAN
jgi:dienelactone hydrolase